MCVKQHQYHVHDLAVSLGILHYLTNAENTAAKWDLGLPCFLLSGLSDSYCLAHIQLKNDQCSEQSPRGQSDIFYLLVLPKQWPETQRLKEAFTITKSQKPHIQEAGTCKCFTGLLEKSKSKTV